MRRPLLLTGGPAVGKTTTGRRLAAARPLGALVDVDDLRHMVIGAIAPRGTARRVEFISDSVSTTPARWRRPSSPPASTP